jgi:hypothetical protein
VGKEEYEKMGKEEEEEKENVKKQKARRNGVGNEEEVE